MAVKTVKVEAAKVEAAKNETVKSVEAVKSEAVKAEAKVEAKKETVKKEVAKKEPAKKAVAKKEPAKKEVKASSKAQLFIQYYDRELTADFVEAKVKEAWAAETGKKESDIKSIKIYVKPIENVAYYVINEDNLGHVVL